MAQTDPEDGFDQIMVQSWNSVAQQLRDVYKRQIYDNTGILPETENR